MDSLDVSCQLASLPKLLATVVAEMSDFGLIMHVISVFPEGLLVEESRTTEVTN